jgi:hypothetical protein
MIEQVDPFVHLFLTKRLKEIVSHPYYISILQSEKDVKLSSLRVCLIGLLVCAIKYDISEKCKCILSHYSFTDYFPTKSEKLCFIRKCVQYKKIDMAKDIIISDKTEISFEDSIELGYEGYILYVLSEKNRLQKGKYPEIEYEKMANNEDTFKIDMGSFSIFRQIENNLSRRFLTDCMKESMDPKTYLSHVLSTRGLPGLHPYLDGQLNQELTEEIERYIMENQVGNLLDTIEEETEI